MENLLHWLWVALMAYVVYFVAMFAVCIVIFTVIYYRNKADMKRASLLVVAIMSIWIGGCAPQIDAQATKGSDGVDRANAKVCNVELTFEFSGNPDIIYHNLSAQVVIVNLYRQDNTLFDQVCLWPYSGEPQPGQDWALVPGLAVRKVALEDDMELTAKIWLGSGTASYICAQAIDSISSSSFHECEDSGTTIHVME